MLRACLSCENQRPARVSAAPPQLCRSRFSHSELRPAVRGANPFTHVLWKSSYGARAFRARFDRFHFQGFRFLPLKSGFTHM